MTETTSPQIERRAADRHPCRVDNPCLMIVSCRQQSRWARPMDIATTGLRLTTSGPFEPGAILLIELLSRPGQPPLTLVAEVMHSALQPDGNWTLGCRFDNLSGNLEDADRELLESLVRQQTSAERDPIMEDALLTTLAHPLRNPFRPYLQTHRRPASGDSRINLLFDVLLATRKKLRLQRQWVDLNVLVAHTVAAIRTELESRQLQLNSQLPAEPMLLPADPARLQESLTSLLLALSRRCARRSRLWFSIERHDGHALLRLGCAEPRTPLEVRPAVPDLLDIPETSADEPDRWEAMQLALAHETIELHGGQLQVLNRGSSVGSELHIRFRLVGEARESVRSR